MDRGSEATTLRDRLDLYSPGGKWLRGLLGFRAVVDFNLVMTVMTSWTLAQTLTQTFFDAFPPKNESKQN